FALAVGHGEPGNAGGHPALHETFFLDGVERGAGMDRGACREQCSADGGKFQYLHVVDLRMLNETTQRPDGPGDLPRIVAPGYTPLTWGKSLPVVHNSGVSQKTG